MRTVWKHVVVDPGEFAIDCGGIAEVVHVGLDPHGQGCVWFEHDTGAINRVALRCRIYGTGHEISSGWEHVGSYVLGDFVWHVYAYAPWPEVVER